MSDPEREWIAVEETEDAAFADQIELALRGSGLPVRVQRNGPGTMIEVLVPVERLDDALAALEPFDADNETPTGDDAFRTPGREL